MHGCLIALLVIAGLFAGCMVLTAIGAATRDHSSSPTAVTTTMSTVTSTVIATNAPAPIVAVPTGIEITGRALYAEYEANEVAADNRYKGRKLLVKGLVTSIEKDFMDNIVVHLAGGQYEFDTVMATLEDSQNSAAATLNKGDVIKLACTGGARIVSTPTLSDCTIVNKHAE
jgi:hypothetical protein